MLFSLSDQLYILLPCLRQLLAKAHIVETFGGLRLHSTFEHNVVFTIGLNYVNNNNLWIRNIWNIWCITQCPLEISIHHCKLIFSQNLKTNMDMTIFRRFLCWPKLLFDCVIMLYYPVAIFFRQCRGQLYTFLKTRVK